MIRWVAILVVGLVATAPVTAQQPPPPLQPGQEPPMRNLTTDAGYFRTMVFSPDGKSLAAGVAGGDQVVVWDVASTQLLTKLQMPKKNHDYHLAFSADGRTVYSEGREDEMIRSWTVGTGKQLKEVKRDVKSRFMAFSADGQRMAVVAGKPLGTLTVFDVKTGKPVREFKEVITCVGAAFSNDGRVLATHSGEGEIILWNTETGKKIRTIREKVKYGAGAFNFVVFSPDGKLLASGGHIDKQIRIWDTTTGKQRAVLDCNGFFCSASFSPDNNLLATGSTDGLVLFDLSKNVEICKLKPPFPGQYVTFSPDGSVLAVGGDKGNVYLYDLPPTKVARLPKELTPAEADALWKDLPTNNDFRFQEIVATLKSASKDALVMLGRNLKPVPDADRKDVLQKIADLDDEKVVVRDKAMKDLQAVAFAFEPLLVEQQRNHKAGEIRNRLTAVLEKMKESATPPEVLTAVRAVGVLEQIGNTEARRQLESLAKGASHARITVEAQAALSRLGKGTKGSK
jgi:WD40 repeat protein